MATHLVLQGTKCLGLAADKTLYSFPSEQTKGAYTTYEQQQGGQGQVKQEPQQSWGQQQVRVNYSKEQEIDGCVQGRSDRSSMPPPQAQKFVAASQPIKQEQ